MIDLVKVKDKARGNLKAHDILKKIVDSETLLGLSGGTTPNYTKMIIKPGDILPGAAFIVDERWTEDEDGTNLSAIKKIGLNKFFAKHKIDFYGIPNKGESGCNCDDCECSYGAEEVAEGFNVLLCELFAKYPKKVGVMGIGSNVHTAGIFPNSVAAHSPDCIVSETVDDKFPQRITMTLKALGQFQNFIILAFGEEKREAIAKMLNENENDMQKYPAIFYRKAKAKTWLITDIQS